jgi:NAD(P)-dependent dehydrogenase (short-subunit alcohol dehydrogenase family)
VAWNSPDLSDRVAIVTGASRGVGKGVALVLGECGATVYVTGRSTRDRSGAGPGTVDDTADEVSALGGRGVASILGDPDVMRFTGTGAQAATYARRYGFTDVDGRVIEPFALPDEYRLVEAAF